MLFRKASPSREANSTCEALHAGSAHPVVSVWSLDKRAMASGTSAAARDWERFLQLSRKDAHALARLKHPAILKMVEPFEETRSQLIFVTELIVASGTMLLEAAEASAKGSRPTSEQLDLDLLEIKHGLLQV